MGMQGVAGSRRLHLGATWIYHAYMASGHTRLVMVAFAMAVMLYLIPAVLFPVSTRSGLVTCLPVSPLMNYPPRQIPDALRI